MIQIGSTSREMDPALLRAPGGFAWWYADLVTPDGDGVVLIWSFGLPFLPGYADASRRGAPQLPADRPSVNVVAYSRGVPTVYLLQEYPAAEASWADADGAQRIGRCRFLRTAADGRCSLDADLDCPVPGSSKRLTGRVRVQGVARISPEEPSSDDAPHLWTPLTGPAEGTAVLRLGGREVARVSGRAYHDRNGGSVPLHALGIERWMWGRFPLEGREAVYYLLWPRGGGAPECLGVVLHADGSTEEVPALDVETGPERRSFAGLRWAEWIRLWAGGERWLEVRHRALADVGPFYLRLLSEGTVAGGESALGWGELCVPDRVDLPLHRPLVRMRVHRVGGANSLWLPLFTGPRRRRAARLLRHALAGGRG
ncbi:MAG TPA: hypothetical protein VGR37_05710 [Longimicrobiaceae bacterium]|nr:hypothetical protein [Longimicrobiaceae bacterium]